MKASQHKRLRKIAKRATKRDDKPGFSRLYKAMKKVFISNGKAGINKSTGRGVVLAFEKVIQ